MKFHGYPHRYYQRGKICDIKFILSRMAELPEELKLSVSKEYEKFKPWLGGENRKAANIWLNNQALQFRRAPSARDDIASRVDLDCKPPESTAKEFKTNIDASAPVKAKGFLDGLLDDIDRKNRNR